MEFEKEFDIQIPSRFSSNGFYVIQLKFYYAPKQELVFGPFE